MRVEDFESSAEELRFNTVMKFIAEWDKTINVTGRREAINDSLWVILMDLLAKVISFQIVMDFKLFSY